MKYRIFIVEDDSVISGAVASGLSGWGFDTVCAEDFSAVDREFAACSPQLVLLDISLPFCNGYRWCREIRRISPVPIIFISSSSDNMNIVMAMNMGGDDFIAKPFDLDVLAAKVQALLRRTYDLSKEALLLEADGVVLNIGDASLTVNGKTVALTKNEYRVLEVLMRSRGNVVTRDTLMLKLWETDSYVDDNTLTVNVTRLRKKLAESGAPDLIKTKKGVGYMI